jgi:hypothetical protein
MRPYFEKVTELGQGELIFEPTLNYDISFMG